MDRSILTVKQFSQKNPAFSEASIRALRFNENNNGFAPAFLKMGRKVLVDEQKFFELLDAQNRAA